jgi:hypothetical protein
LSLYFSAILPAQALLCAAARARAKAAIGLAAYCVRAKAAIGLAAYRVRIACEFACAYLRSAKVG